MTVTIMNKQSKLDPFFNQDIFDLKKHQSKIIREIVNRRKSSVFDFRKVKEPLKSELKHYLQDVLSKKISAKNISSTYLTPLLHLIDFFSEHQENVSLKTFSKELEDEYRTFLQRKSISVQHSINGKSVPLRILERASLFVMDLYNGEYPFEKDIWRLDEMGIDATRFIESNPRKTISFYTIPNTTNKKVAKEYVKYLITTTDKAISTIYSKYKSIKTFLTFLNDNEIMNVNRDDIERFIESLNEKKLKNETFNCKQSLSFL